MSATFASMRYVNYRYWFVASLIASTGAWLQRVAQDWYVLTVLTDHDASQVGLVTALQFLPIILFSAWARVLAGEWTPAAAEEDAAEDEGEAGEAKA